MAKGAIELSGPGLKKLRVLAGRLEELAIVKRRIAATQAEEALDLVKVGFASETDPYGRKWQARKKETRKTRGRKVLSGPTSRLKGGWHRTALSADGWRISPSVDYALPHQSPKKNRRPQRMMVPSEARGFPNRWRRPMNEAAEEAILGFLKGK